MFRVVQPDGSVAQVRADYLLPKGHFFGERHGDIKVPGIHPDLIREGDDIILVKYRFHEHVN